MTISKAITIPSTTNAAASTQLNPDWSDDAAEFWKSKGVELEAGECEFESSVTVCVLLQPLVVSKAIAGSKKPPYVGNKGC